MILEVYIHLLHFWVGLGSSALQGQISSERLITFNLRVKCQPAVFSEENNQLCNLCEQPHCQALIGLARGQFSINFLNKDGD